MGYGKGIPNLVPTLTWQCSPQAENIVAQYGPGSVVVDLGAGGRRIAPYVTTVDFVKLDDTDIVCDVAATPFENGSVDLVIATGLLEHLEDDDPVFREILRIL